MKRHTDILNLQQYSEINPPYIVAKIDGAVPLSSQMILRMLVRSPYSNGLQLPESLEWTRKFIDKADAYQSNTIGVKHPFTYVTVRHGIVESEKDDEWHVDGFSMQYNHLPEANYVIVIGPEPTEYVIQRFNIPNGFDPMKHNIHPLLGNRIQPANIHTMHEGIMYFMDPYVVHRRPPSTKGKQRTFVRISYVPIEIPDVNNTPNEKIHTPHYVCDGRIDFREKLIKYDDQI